MIPHCFSCFWATMPPHTALLVAIFALLVGIVAGLWGYDSARRQAFRDYVAAHQRSRLAMIEVRQ